MMCHHHNYYYCYKLKGGTNACPCSAAKIQKRKTGVVVLSAGHKHPALPSRKFLSMIVVPLSQRFSYYSGGWVWGRGEVGSAGGGRGRNFSCNKHTSLSVSFPTPTPPSLGMIGQRGTFSGPWDYGENRTADHIEGVGHAQGKTAH